MGVRLIPCQLGALGSQLAALLTTSTEAHTRRGHSLLGSLPHLSSLALEAPLALLLPLGSHPELLLLNQIESSREHVSDELSSTSAQGEREAQHNHKSTRTRASPTNNNSQAHEQQVLVVGEDKNHTNHANTQDIVALMTTTVTRAREQQESSKRDVRCSTWLGKGQKAGRKKKEERSRGAARVLLASSGPAMVGSSLHSLAPAKKRAKSCLRRCSDACSRSHTRKRAL